MVTLICTALTAVGLGGAFWAAKRRRLGTALRLAALALLPAGLAMAGLVQLVVDYFTFDPVAWAGLGVLGLSLLLFLGGRLADGSRRRRAAGADGTAPPAGRSAAPAAPAAPSLPASGRGGKAPAADADDFSDIEAILKKHGI